MKTWNSFMNNSLTFAYKYEFIIIITHFSKCVFNVQGKRTFYSRTSFSAIHKIYNRELIIINFNTSIKSFILKTHLLHPSYSA